MPTLEPAYEANKFEDDIYKKWEDSGVFTAKIVKDKKPFVISMPPPNATGILHLGHALTCTLEDIMIRYHRMKGDPVLWLPGTDHAGIATQTKYEKIIAEKGLTRHSLGREKFIEEVKAYVQDTRTTIQKQLRKMGSSCDWSREEYTFSDRLSVAVNTIFTRMFNDGLIYKGERIVNWCPRCYSTLADDEVTYKDEKGKLYWLKYGPFTLATTRPETKLGDTAVAVNPNDERYKDMVGKKYMIPGVLGDFEIIVVADDAVDMEFGSGAVKVTPAHSFVDFEIAQRHKVPIKKIINEEGKMMGNCGKYAGMTTKQCRREILEDMKNMGILIKEEDYEHKLSVCYRCESPIEPLTSKQWFVDVNKKVSSLDNKSLKEKALEVVKDGSIKIIPGTFNKTYFNWINNLRDWCISRQIWWGHRIPVWYCNKCDEFFASVEKPSKCTKCAGTEFTQDPDTLDTWFSSALWTFSTLGWPADTEDLKYFHPTSVLETGYDIIFFWVARMIIMSTYALNDIPFEKVYLHGIIRDIHGKKMSKSKGNGIDPLEMINKYGTDALRLSLVVGNTAGKDMRIGEEKISGYRNFINKIWNASRFVLMNITDEDLKDNFSEENIKTVADKWIISELNTLIKETDAGLKNYKFSEAGQKLYDFFWTKFCDWYLELSKGTKQNKHVLIYVLKTFYKLIHPFAPFITENLWEKLTNNKEMLINAQWPKYSKKLNFEKDSKKIKYIMDLIVSIRSKRTEFRIDAKTKINIEIFSKNEKETYEELKEDIIKLAGLERLEINSTNADNHKTLQLVNSDTSYFLEVEKYLDVKSELARYRKELVEVQRFILISENKLNNETFSQKAPANIVERERNLLEENKKIEEKLTEIIKNLEKI